MSNTVPSQRVRPDKVTAISVWFFLNAIVPFLGSVAILFFALPVVIRDSVADPDRFLAIGGVVFGLSVVIGLCALNVAAAVGLLKLQEWARWLALGLAFLGLILIPIHTIIGGLIIWYLLSDEAKQAFGVPQTEVRTDSDLVAP